MEESKKLKAMLQEQSKNWLIDHILELGIFYDDNQVVSKLCVLKERRDLAPFWQALKKDLDDAYDYSGENEYSRLTHNDSQSTEAFENWDAGPKLFVTLLNLIARVDSEKYVAEQIDAIEYALNLIFELRKQFGLCLKDEASMFMSLRGDICGFSNRSLEQLGTDLANLSLRFEGIFEGELLDTHRVELHEEGCLAFAKALREPVLVS